MNKAVDLVGIHDIQGDFVVPYLVEVELLGEQKDTFLKIRETLSRIGIIPSRQNKVLYQTCHILQKKKKFYIVHYKSLFVLDGRKNDLTIGDIARSNRITKLMEEWGLVKVKNPKMIEDPICNIKHIGIVKFKEKMEWNLQRKYALGTYNG